MSVNENDLQALHAYIDSELSMDECEALWRRLSRENDLVVELDRLRADVVTRQAVWTSMELQPEAARPVESVILRAARRQNTLGQINRALTIVTSLAACILFGFTVGWLGRAQHMPSPGNTATVNVADTSAGGRTAPDYVVYVRDQGGNVVAEHQFKSLQDARQFANEMINAQANRPAGGNSMVVPVEERF